jgi:hypothetical protein
MFNIDPKYQKDIFFNFFQYLKSNEQPYVSVRTFPPEAQTRNIGNPALFQIQIEHFLDLHSDTVCYIVDMYGNFLPASIIYIDATDPFTFTIASPYYQDREFDVLLINLLTNPDPEIPGFDNYTIPSNSTIISEVAPFVHIQVINPGLGPDTIISSVRLIPNNIDCLFHFDTNGFLDLFYVGNSILGPFDIVVSVPNPQPPMPNNLFTLFLVGNSNEIIENAPSDYEYNLVIQDYASTINSVNIIDESLESKSVSFVLDGLNLLLHFDFPVTGEHFLIELTINPL